jgi:hypothetical protein
MPPGVWHAVYTATPSFTGGGHFFSYDTLHLTEFSCAFDVKNLHYLTNANHRVDQILSHMMLALPIVSQTQSDLFHCFFPSNIGMLELSGLWGKPILEYWNLSDGPMQMECWNHHVGLCGTLYHNV